MKAVPATEPLRTSPLEATSASRSRGRQSVNGWLLVLPAVAYLLVWTVYPLFYALYVSLTDKKLNRPRSGEFVGVQNFQRLIFEDPTFWVSIRNTLWLMAISIVVEIVLAYGVAKLFFRAQHLRGVNVMRTIFVIPIMVTPLIVGLFWSYILNPTLGVANFVLANMRLPTVEWFGNPSLVLYTLAGINAWQWAPFMMLLVLAGLNSIPKELQEVSTLEGANWWQRLQNLEIPFLKEVVLLGVFIRVMEGLKLFDIVYATTNGGPGTATEVVSLLAYRQSFLYYNTAYGAATAILILVLSTILVQVLFRLLVRRESP